MIVHWTETAQDHITAIFEYIALDSLEYAKRIVDGLTKRTQQIGDFPYSGRVVPEFEKEKVREVIEGPYRIIYFIKPQQIEILAVLHGDRHISPNCRAFLPES